MGIFYVEGPVPHDAPSYAERPADLKVRHLLLKGHPVCLVGPPLVGKSSLLLRLGALLAPGGFEHRHVDVSLPIGSSPLETLESFLEECSKAPQKLLVTVDGLEEFLPGNLPSAFRLLRRFLKRKPEVLLVAGGTFIPSPGQISPFKEVRLGFLYRPQVLQIVSLLELEGQQLEGVTDAIYRWSGGHPYLVQSLCVILEQGGFPLTGEGVGKAVKVLLQTDVRLLPRLLKALRADPGALQLARVLYEGGRVKFSAALPLIQRNPVLWGCFRSDEKGFCRFSSPLVRCIFSCEGFAAVRNI
ncbi:MAG: hypothetical protein DRI61_04195 [Chloroflexi bacterium]|nr:MAG: hypothetical protein DRI61_04195 [Chloroflexota bacterium]